MIVLVEGKVTELAQANMPHSGHSEDEKLEFIQQGKTTHRQLIDCAETNCPVQMSSAFISLQSSQYLSTLKQKYNVNFKVENTE